MCKNFEFRFEYIFFSWIWNRAVITSKFDGHVSSRDSIIIWSNSRLPLREKKMKRLPLNDIIWFESFATLPGAYYWSHWWTYGAYFLSNEFYFILIYCIFILYSNTLTKFISVVYMVALGLLVNNAPMDFIQVYVFFCLWKKK